MSFPCRASRRLLTESCHARGINVRDHVRLNKYMDDRPANGWLAIEALGAEPA